MLKHIIDFYRVSAAKPCNGEPLAEQQRRLKRLQWSTFLSATVGYGVYYVCRLSLNVVKKPIVEEGIFSETELGIIGSVLFSRMRWASLRTVFWPTAATSGVS